MSQRCLACRELDRHGRVGECRSCARHLPLDGFRRCRLCANARRDAQLAGDPAWAVEPGQRGHIQLFFADLHALPAHRRVGERAGDTDSPPAGPATTGAEIVGGQERLVWVPPDVGWLTGAGMAQVMAEAPAEPLTAVSSFAETRGWTAATTKAVARAAAVLAQLVPGGPSDEAIAAVTSRIRGSGRVRELLDASAPATVRESAPKRRIEQLAKDLPARFDAEVTAWVETLDGRWGRRRPLSAVTIGHYLNAAGPALHAWAVCYDSLRQVSGDDVAAQLENLHGSGRAMTAVALRSLFAALKARRLVFANPARGVHPGRFPQPPVLGLDGLSRAKAATIPRACQRSRRRAARPLWVLATP